LAVLPDCNAAMNELRWTNPNNTCADDVLKYYIYFGETEDGNFELIDSVLSPTDTVYQHRGLSMISGCYKVTAVDSVGNETVQPQIVCIDTCRQYSLPSVFTPNGDGKNDFFHPCDSTTAAEFQQTKCPPYKNVKSVEMKIYNRWGALVFETKDKNINWDGKNKDTKADCSEGVYYYTCKVFFFSVKQEQSAELHGTIELIRTRNH
jgi:gliding motility-associated-like protein